jgi:hypothetical protein
LWSGVVLWYRERSASVQLVVYSGAVWYCGTESGLLCAAGGVLWSGGVMWYRERSVSVQLAVYCGTVWYCGTESGLLVCRWWCIVERCGSVVQRAVY